MNTLAGSPALLAGYHGALALHRETRNDRADVVDGVIDVGAHALALRRRHDLAVALATGQVELDRNEGVERIEQQTKGGRRLHARSSVERTPPDVSQGLQAA